MAIISKIDNTENDRITNWSPIVIFLCLIATAVVSYKANEDLIKDNAWVEHTYKVLLNIQELLSNLRKAESRQRGYIITHDIYFLNGYEQSLLNVNNKIQTLKELAADNPNRIEQIHRIELLANKRIAKLNEVLNTYNNKGLDAAKNLILSGFGRQTMLDFTNLVETTIQDEQALLKSRKSESQESGNFALNSTVIGWLFIAVLVCISYFYLLKDLNQRKKVAQILAKARENLEAKVTERTLELQRSNRELEEFAFIASHDLQEPLRKIQVFGDRLREKSAANMDPTAIDYLDRMQNAAHRMRGLINDLLTFSRVSTKQQPFVKINLNELIQNVVIDLEGSLAHNSGKAIIEDLPTIMGDSLQVSQLFQNLISNGLKFHKPELPPIITIRWRNKADWTSTKIGMPNPLTYDIAVGDNGIGIEPQHNDKIFAAFQRLHGKSEYEGTGIGLAICRKIIERHKGDIKIESTLGQGSTFIVSFPAIDPDEKKHDNTLDENSVSVTNADNNII